MVTLQNYPGYPADVMDVIAELDATWRLQPPAGKGRGLWIQACRLLRESCGEFGVRRVLQAEYEGWDHARRQGRGYMVTGPQSLVGPCRARAAIMRQQQRPVEQGAWGPVWAEIAAAMEQGSLHPVFSEPTAALVRRCGGWDAVIALDVDVAKVKLEGEFRA